jgi:hypothetical protein
MRYQHTLARHQQEVFLRVLEHHAAMLGIYDLRHRTAQTGQMYPLRLRQLSSISINDIHNSLGRAQITLNNLNLGHLSLRMAQALRNYANHELRLLGYLAHFT